MLIIGVDTGGTFTDFIWKDGRGAGQAGKNLLVRNGETQIMPGKFSLRLEAGDLIRIETPGGGGYGRLRSSKSD